MKIQKIILKNFQCHERLEIDFDDSMFTVISASNNSGKTAISRAAKWLFTNKPRGDWMRKHGTKYTEVKFIFDDNTCVARVKGDGGLNQYKFNGEIFDNPSTTPHCISEYLGSSELTLNNEDILIPITDDSDEPFMINESSTLRGALLSYLTGIDKIDKIKREIGKENNRDKRELTTTESQIERCEEELEKFERLGEAGELIAKCKKLKSKISKLKNKRNEIEDFVRWYNDVESNIEKNKSALKAISAAIVTANKLSTLATKLGNVSKYNIVVARVKASKKAIGVIAKLIKRSETLLKLVKINKELTALDDDLTVVVRRKQSNETQLEIVVEELKKIKSNFKACPKCKTMISKSRWSEING